ncbi:MAG: hypothetical protein IJB83_03790 [Bacilli bacterium]|nr:hypothetical protein [Bacilli bacterium]
MKTLKNCLIYVINFIISTLIYFLEVTLLIIFSINSVLSYRTINTLVQNIEVKEIIKNIDDNDNILDNIYNESKKIGISEKSIDNLLESKEIKNILAKYISSSAKYILKEKGSKDIFIDDIINELKINFKQILKENNENILPKNEEKLNKVIDNISKTLKENLPEIKDSANNINPLTLKYIRLIFNIKTTLIILLTIIVLTTIIALLKKSYYAWTLNLSIATLLSSLLGFFIALVPLFDFSSILPELPEYIMSLLSSGAQIICNNFFIIGIIFFIIGISLIGIYTSYNKKNIKKEQ